MAAQQQMSPDVSTSPPNITLEGPKTLTNGCHYDGNALVTQWILVDVIRSIPSGDVSNETTAILDLTLMDKRSFSCITPIKTDIGRRILSTWHSLPFVMCRNFKGTQRWKFTIVSHAKMGGRIVLYTVPQMPLNTTRANAPIRDLVKRQQNAEFDMADSKKFEVSIDLFNQTAFLWVRKPTPQNHGLHLGYEDDFQMNKIPLQDFYPGRFQLFFQYQPPVTALIPEVFDIIVETSFEGQFFGEDTHYTDPTNFDLTEFLDETPSLFRPSPPCRACLI